MTLAGALRRRLEGWAGRVLEPVVHAASRRGIVPHRGRVRLPGLDDEVAVRFDDHGVPHIRAGSVADAFLAQGFCHALDRFFQMDMLRRVLRGRLAETIGEVRLGANSLPPFGTTSTSTDADRLMRCFDLTRAARRYHESTQDQEGRVLLDAYVAGVNAAIPYLRRCRPLEYRILRLPLVPWTGVDSILVAKGMALGLSFKWRSAPVLAALVERLGDRSDLRDTLLPRAPGAGAPAVTELLASGLAPALAFLPTPSRAQGSNAFVVGSGRSRSGHPLVASDPHLELALPSIWYLASVSGADYSAVGSSLPGLPGVVIGRTPAVAWGVTNGMIDDADLWVEEVDGTGLRYRVDGAWRPLRTETQEIRRRRRAREMFRLRRTHRGPLLSDAFPAYRGPPFSLRMTLHDATPDLQTFLGLGRARTAADVRAAVEGYGSPVQNLVYADVHGEAGYTIMGNVPDRGPGPTPVTPRDGSTTATDWRGMLPRDALPRVRLDADATLVTANDPQVDGSYPHYLSHLYEPPYRAQRIRERLAGRNDLTVDDLAAIQMDVKNGAVSWFRDLVLLPHVEAVRRTRPQLGRPLDRLLAWDGVEHVDASAAALWHLTYHHLLRRIFGGALGPDLLASWLGLFNLVDAPLRRAFEDEDSPWAPTRSRAALVQRALDDALQDLERRGLPFDPPWGAVHRLTLRHPLGAVPLLGAIFNRGPMPYPGSTYTPGSGQYSHAQPAAVTSGASYRHVIDLGDMEGTARMITLGGQSGHVGSRHYQDLTPLWLAGRGIPMRLERWPEKGQDMVLLP